MRQPVRAGQGLTITLAHPGRPLPRAPRVCQGNCMRKYVIMGVPGSGKSSQASWLARDLDLVHISVGDIFRWNVQQHTKMGADVRRIMAAGELVGDDMAERVTAERLGGQDWHTSELQSLRQ